MSKDEITITEDGEVSFDFGFDNFRPMGFTYTGVITSAKIERPKNETFSFVDKRTGATVTKDAKPQLVVLIQPTDHKTKSGNPYPEYLPLTHNSRSKLGAFVEALKNLGITFGADPSKLEGMEFQWEVKEMDFGGAEPTRVACAVAVVDDLAKAAVKTTASPARDRYADLPLAAIGAAVDGRDPADWMVLATAVSKDPRVIAGIADGSLVERLRAEGYVSREPATV